MISSFLNYSSEKQDYNYYLDQLISNFTHRVTPKKPLHQLAQVHLTPCAPNTRRHAGHLKALRRREFNSVKAIWLVIVAAVQLVCAQQHFVPSYPAQVPNYNRLYLASATNSAPLVARPATINQRRSLVPMLTVPGSAQPGARSARQVMLGSTARQHGPPSIVMSRSDSYNNDEIVLPYDAFAANVSSTDLTTSSYVIENKRYVEAVATRCLASTILQNPEAVEPSFIIIKPTSEIRLNATAPAEIIRMAGYEPHKRTTIFVHGFTQSYPNTTWLRRIRALFEKNALVAGHNLIIMDWGRASQGSYAQVAAMVSGMGSFLANFLNKLLELGADRMSIHIIGHSLGAHLAGFAGKRMRPRLGRITALDPAGPCFGKILSNSAQDRLGPDDAYEVDVYHYDDDFLGLPGQHGQFDVYVNGGSSQPGCSPNLNTMFQAFLTMVFRRNRVLSESHTRSTEVPCVQLANTGCQQVAYECRDYATFTQGECGRCDDFNSQCFLMSFWFQWPPEQQETDVPLRTSFPGKRLYISTGPSESFCTNHYQILVKFEPTPELNQLTKRGLKLRIQLELLSDLGRRVNVSVTNPMQQHIYSYLMLMEVSQEPPWRFRAARLQVRAADGSQVPLAGQPVLNSQVGQVIGSGIRVYAVDVNFMSNINPNVRRSLSARLCPAPPSWFARSSPGGATGLDVNSIQDSAEEPNTQALGWAYFDECLAQPSSHLQLA